LNLQFVNLSLKEPNIKWNYGNENQCH